MIINFQIFFLIASLSLFCKNSNHDTTTKEDKEQREKKGLLQNIWENVTKENITEKLKSEIASFSDRINKYEDKIESLLKKTSGFDDFLNDTGKKSKQIENILGPVFSLTLSAVMIYFYYNNSHTSLFNNNKKKIKPITIKDIAGNKEVITKITNAIKLAKKKKSMTSILLEGPPGTGKTVTVQAILNELGIKYDLILPSDIFGMFLGETEKKITHILSTAKKNAPYAIIIDECEELFGEKSNRLNIGQNGGRSGTEQNMKNILLQYMGGTFDMEGVILIGITNNKELIDPAFLRTGRFGRNIIHVGYPDEEDRVAIITYYLRKTQLTLGEDITIEDMTTKLSGTSQADIATFFTDNTFTDNKITQKEFNSYLLTDIIGKKHTIKKITLQDIAGNKKNITKIQQVIKKSQKNTNMTCILLEGPPGTGKTITAQAILNDMRIQNKLLLPSDILSPYIGESEKKITKILSDAQMQAPYVLIIDECEKIFEIRNKNTANAASSQSDNVKNILLQYMDGAFNMKGVILIGITNHKELIDPAFLRKGRFSNIINIGYPIYDDRIDIISHYIKKANLSLDESLTMEYMASKLEGMSPADISSLFMDNTFENNIVNKKQFIDFYLNLIMGENNEAIIIDDTEKKNISIHEIGHALLTYIFDTRYDGLEEFDFVTNIPRMMTLGASHSKSPLAYKSATKERLIQKIDILLGGRIAQEIILNNIDSGAQNDLERAKEIAKKMITTLGMGKYISGEYKSEELVNEVNSIINNEYALVKSFITKNKKLILKLAEELFKNNILYKEDIARIIDQYEKDNNTKITFDREEKIYIKKTPKVVE